MNTIGVFSGRGDVILAMAMALVLGIFIGWKAKQFYIWINTKFRK
jgi:hypothetical protein